MVRGHRILVPYISYYIQTLTCVRPITKSWKGTLPVKCRNWTLLLTCMCYSTNSFFFFYLNHSIFRNSQTWLDSLGPTTTQRIKISMKRLLFASLSQIVKTRLNWAKLHLNRLLPGNIITKAHGRSCSRNGQLSVKSGSVSGQRSQLNVSVSCLTPFSLNLIYSAI